MTFAILQTPTGPLWQKVGICHHHGIDVDLPALLSQKSCGIGEYLDLLPVLDYCKKIGFDIVQLLPLNDSELDPSPYNNLSSIALHPIYLSLYALPHLEHFPLLVEQLSIFKPYNLLPKVDFRHVFITKMHWLKDYFSLTHELFSVNQEYVLFKAKNPWLETYGLFKVLKEKFGYISWELWPAEYQNLSPERHKSLIQQFQEGIEFYSILQYLCFEQLKFIRNTADSHQLLLKGDIPMLVSRDSVDAWHAPRFFNFNLSAGAPPDPLAKEGQYWGFPLYNWEALRQDDYLFWKERLRYASQFFHLFRIDHIVGFFKIWGIPYGKSATTGSFFPKDPAEWIPQGEHLLKMLIGSSDMLPIGEDLGAVTKEIRASMKLLGIPGTKVLRWERNYENSQEYLPFDKYPLLSLSCVSTHDSETLTLWWESNEEETRAFCLFKGWNYTPTLSPERRFEILKDSHRTSSLLHINLLQEYFALFQELVAEDPEEERINVPSKLLKANWVYRYRTPIETWSSHPGLERVFKMLREEV